LRGSEGADADTHLPRCLSTRIRCTAGPESLASVAELQRTVRASEASRPIKKSRREAKDEDDARKLEPFASAPAARFETLRRLAEAGVPVGVAFAPLIPGLNDHQIPEVLARARAAGATSAFLVLLRLPAEVRPVFEERLRATFPLRAAKVEHALREMKDGALNRSEFGLRMRGSGPRWDALRQLFHLQCRRLGLAVR
jgi:DNA repair photolyase